MFHGPESNGRRINNQGYFTSMVGSGTCRHPFQNDNDQVELRGCRTNPAYEYGWEAANRIFEYDIDNDSTTGLPPGVPLVANSTRLRWIRR